jgi:hypothetical protein
MNLRENFLKNGFIVIEDFIPLNVLERIRLELLKLIELQVPTNSIPEFSNFDFKDSQNLDEAFLILREYNAKITSKIYAAAKKLPSIAQFVSSDAHLQIARTLIGTPNVAFSDRGWGLRIDYPNDVKHATPLHQDYHTQIGSLNGVVIWVPLTDVTLDMGPLIFYPGSDKLGIQKIKLVENQSLSTDLELDISPEILDSLSPLQPEVKAGTAVIINYLLLHKSGQNHSSKNRWSILSRWFDFENEAAIERGWHGGFQEGYRFEEVHPEFKTV